MTTPYVCRSCGAGGLETILDLGATPLANSLLSPEGLQEAEPTFPLIFVFCPQCTLAQITETVPPDILFGHYFYFSSFSDTMLRHAEDLASAMCASEGLGAESLVVEAASNDGYLLQYYQNAGVPVLGIEPAKNVAAVAEEKGIRTRNDFFSKELAARLVEEGWQADVFHANNVLAHVADLNGFVEGMKLLLGAQGVGVIEVPYVKEMIEKLEFDTIYHEHLCYFSLTALSHLMERHELRIVDVQQLRIHGGSLRIFVKHQDAAAQVSEAVSDLLAQEQGWGVGAFAFYEDFGRKVEALGEKLKGLLEGLKAQGKQIAVYGASAKGSTLLNVFGLDSALLDFVVDRSTYKQSHYTPGTHLPIYPPEKLLEEQPDYVLLLTWNFAREILSQQAEYQRRGGRFILPLPEPRVVEESDAIS